MKKIIQIVFIGFLISCSTNKKNGQTKSKIIKSITEANYSARNDGEINRDIALKENVFRKEFFNERGKLIESWEFNPEINFFIKTKLTRDDSGNLLSGKTENHKGKIVSYYTTKIDSIGNIIEYKTYNSKNEITNIQSSKFDLNGNEIEIKSVSINYGYTNKTNFSYNKKNQIIEKIKYNGARGKTDKRVYKYDDNGNNIEVLIIRDDKSEMIIKNSYDNKNNLIKDIWFENEEQTHETSFLYIYDNSGNWITKKRTSNGKLNSIWEREISYY